MAPTVTQRFTTAPSNPAATSWPRRRIIDGLRVALIGPLG